MTLHEAIEFVLRKNGHPMSSRDIADAINSQNLYQRGDGKPVPSSQISARINHHLTLFDRVDDKIRLIR